MPASNGFVINDSRSRVPNDINLNFNKIFESLWKKQKYSHGLIVDIELIVSSDLWIFRACLK